MTVWGRFEKTLYVILGLDPGIQSINKIPFSKTSPSYLLSFVTKRNKSLGVK
ncbi:hypothetical protein KGV55_02980 [Candidatus Gracilibacteria bacterium]|nr:hypothetical protein [Candidatus Gracilibacteria bacterium]